MKTTSKIPKKIKREYPKILDNINYWGVECIDLPLKDIIEDHRRKHRKRCFEIRGKK